jgi:hypothetical protein
MSKGESTLCSFIEALRTDLQTAKKMLDSDPSLLSLRDPCGETALHYLAIEDELEAVSWLISMGAEVNPRSQEDETPLSDAAGLGNLDMVKLLLAHGAAPNVAGIRGSPLGRATSVEIVEPLLAAGADPNFAADDPLGQAVAGHRRAVAERLVRAGARIDGCQRDQAPLQAAAFNADAEIFEWLLGLGADPMAKSADNMTVLHLAAAGGSIDIIERLLALGLDPKATNMNGETPGQLARRLGNVEAAKRLEGG